MNDSQPSANHPTLPSLLAPSFNQSFDKDSEDDAASLSDRRPSKLSNILNFQEARTSNNLVRQPSLPQGSHSPQQTPKNPDESYSPQSVRSDTSFKTCPSEPSSSSVPRKVSDSRKPTSDQTGSKTASRPPQMRNAIDQKPNGAVQQKRNQTPQQKVSRPKNSYSAT